MEREEYIALIVSNLNGTINKDDAKTLAIWRKENQDNEALYQETASFWKQSERYKENIKIDASKAWERINSEIKTETKRISIFSRYRKIAAAIVVLFATTFFISTFLNSEITVATAENETKKVVLPDGSSITLNENSSITYAKNFNKRDVTLNGEAFFEVVKNENSPFIVNANTTKTTVLGTSFNINTHLPDTTTVALFTGKVKFESYKNLKILNPGEILVYDKLYGDIKVIKKNLENEISWKTKVLVFKKTKIKDVFYDLEKAFDISIGFKNQGISNCTFSGKFKDASIKEILDAISFSFNAKYTSDGNSYVFEDLNCKE